MQPDLKIDKDDGSIFSFFLINRFRQSMAADPQTWLEFLEKNRHGFFLMWLSFLTFVCPSFSLSLAIP